MFTVLFQNIQSLKDLRTSPVRPINAVTHGTVISITGLYPDGVTRHNTARLESSMSWKITLQQGALNVNNSLRWATLSALFLALVISTSSVFGQARSVNSLSSQPSAGDRIAVIDINYIFNNHTGFKQLVEAWKKDVQAAESEIKGENTTVEKMVEDLKRFKVGTDDFKRREETIAQKRAAVQVQMQIKKKDLMVREAKMYLSVYEQVQKQVAFFAKQNSITLVLRFNRGEVDSENPRQIQQALLRPVVFQDRIDITVDILNRVNPTQVGRAPARGTPRNANQR